MCVHCLSGPWPRVKVGWDAWGASCAPGCADVCIETLSPVGMPNVAVKH